MKKIISLFIVLSVLVSALLMMSVSTSADPAPAVWDGSTAAAFAGGDGTEANPYQISNGAELALLQAKIADGEQAANYYNKYYILTADIVLNEGDATTWGKPDPNDPADPPATIAPANSYKAIGAWSNATSSFGGTFDGNGKTISGLYIKSEADGQGLFGVIQGGAVIKNFALVNSYIEAPGCVGGIVGQTDRANDDDILFENIYTDAIINSTSGAKKAAGIIGNVSGTKADPPYEPGKITIKSTVFAGEVTYSANEAGGFIGYSAQAEVEITDCLNAGTITGASTKNYIAGFVGRHEQVTVALTRCISAGEMKTKENYYGGIFVASNEKTGATLSDCYYVTGIAAATLLYYNVTEDEQAKAVELRSLCVDCGITWENWTKRTGDILVPTGVASFAQQIFQLEYTVTWMNGEEVLAVENYALGTMPEYKGEVPTKAEDERYTYSFNRWTPELKAVMEDATYTAEFFRTKKTSGTTAATEDDTTTAPTTDAPTTTKAPESKPAKKGCKSVIGGGVLVLVAVMGIGAVSLGKKED